MDQPIRLTDLLKPGFIERLMQRSVWPVDPVSERPVIELERWLVMQLPDGSSHFVGWNITDQEGRATTSIVEFDPATCRGATASGRVYVLIGPTGPDRDGVHTWRRWMRIQNQKTAVDVSLQFQARIHAARSQVGGSVN